MDILTVKEVVVFANVNPTYIAKLNRLMNGYSHTHTHTHTHTQKHTNTQKHKHKKQHKSLKNLLN